MRKLALIAILFAFVSVAYAQPPHSCGQLTNMSVAYDRDAAGFMPRFKEGSQEQFDCIARRDVSFNNQRFDAGWKALNYWLVLYGQELGVTLQPLPGA